MSQLDGTEGKQGFRILSLDGGGMRGAFTAGYLAEIERVVGRPIGEYFDLLAGTSTGGIIAAGLAFRVPASRIRDFYRDQGPAIFRRRWRSPSGWRRGLGWLDRTLRPACRIPAMVLDPALKHMLGIDLAWVTKTKYSEKALTCALEDVFGSRVIAQAENRLLIPSVNVVKGQTKVFKTPHLPHLYIDRECRVVDVLRATSAAPTYFPDARIDAGSAYVDGGLWANNPVVAAIVESMAIADAARGSALYGEPFGLGSTYALSIGTGTRRFFANPPGPWAGLAWWNPVKLIDLISVSQSQGAQFQASFLLSSRLERIEFELPNGDWSLDNARRVEIMIHMGKEKAAKDIARLRGPFFSTIAPKYLPIPAVTCRK